MFLSWQRDDQAFFAAGACHILAYLFVQLHHGEGYRMIFIKPSEGFSGMHLYASDGEWAFDHNGWTKEVELLKVTKEAYANKHPGWTYQKIILENTTAAFEDFCKTNNHRLPWQYAYLPWERAYTYISRFSASPRG